MDFFDALLRYEIDLWNHLDDQLTRSGEPRLAVLLALRSVARHPGSARVAELQSDMRITVGAASKFADRLERDGLASRRPNPDDRRSSILELTPAGRAAHDSGVAALERALAAHLVKGGGGGGVDLDDLTRMTGTLRSLTARLDTEPVR